MTRLHIAMVAPPWYAVPPEGYGGIELVVHLLSQELRRRGHRVTLFGREGSTSGDEVVELAPKDWSTQLTVGVHKQTYLHRAFKELLARHAQRSGAFDLVHDHNSTDGMLIAGLLDLGVPVVETLHESIPDPLAAFLGEVDDDINLVAISEAQRGEAPGVNWAGVVHNAIDVVACPAPLALAERSGYLVQLARIDPEKGQHVAIEVARRARMPLVLAGKLEPTPECRQYFETEIEPHLGSEVTWIPEVAGQEKYDLLARACAMLFPLQWAEPFGLAMAESMACGTPVIAFDRGAARELVEPGVNGFLANDAQQMFEQVARTDEIDPERCAAWTRDRFGPERMTTAYEKVYREATTEAETEAATS